jgi:Dolichyl-phosphate-mannose-protein mannosyltransferase
MIARSSALPLAQVRQTRRERWLVPAVLAAPFLATVAALRGMTATLPIFHGSDERVYQYPTILRFSHQLPFPDVHDYNAAQTPLFHLLMAYAGKLVGFQLWRLRLVEVAISYLLALAVYALLHRRVGIERTASLVLSLLFVLSPYVFGASFRLMTDNLALLFSVLALERFERFRQTSKLGPYLVGCACAGAAVLTRQSTAFMFGVGALYALRPGALTARRQLAAFAGIGLAALPAALLFLNWHGLVPPGGDPSSCGLCSSPHAAAGAHAGETTGSGLQLRTAELGLATVGLYGAVLFAPLALVALERPRRIAGRGRFRASRRTGVLCAALAGVILLLAFPASPGPNAAGAIWRVAGDLPSVDGSSLVFWVLVPLAGAVLWLRASAARHPWAVVAFTLCFLVSALVIRFPWQKYVDPFALLVLLLTVRTRELSSPRLLVGAAVLAVAFVAYAVDLSAHQSTSVAGRGRPVDFASSRLSIARPSDTGGRREVHADDPSGLHPHASGPGGLGATVRG